MQGLSCSAIIAVFALLASLSCGSKSTPTTPPPPPPPPPPPVTVASVAVSGGGSVTAGQSTQFSATANMSNSTTQNVSSTATWSSSNNAFATVSGTGLATGVAAGTAQIRATFQNVTGEASLQVTAAAPPPPNAPVAQFTVTGPSGTDTCKIVADSGGDFDCTFDGSASTPRPGITTWIWRFDVGGNSSLPITEDDPTTRPNNRCGNRLDPNLAPQIGNTGATQMIVKLVVRNAAGVESVERRNNNVRLIPNNQCGFTF